ncbi:MAG: PASTA domain-containing protein [Alistipes sp.]|nr:PASTA domain-containing protein [Alistipes sp.]
MENPQREIKRPQRRVVRRPQTASAAQSSRSPKGSGQAKPTFWSKVVGGIGKFRRSWPILFNLLVISAIFFGVVYLSEFAMNIFTRHGQRIEVPNFLGENVRDAEPMAKTKDMEIIISDSLYIPGYEGGIIVDQLPRGGAMVKSGRKIYVTINSFTQKKVRVPYVAGRSLRQAKNMLEIAGLGIDKLIYEPDLATNYVLAEVVRGVTMKSNSEIDIEVGSGVVLKVGVNPEENETIVPKVIGCSLREACSRLWEQGLNVGKVSFDEGINKLSEKDARVYMQSINNNVHTTLGRSVDLSLTLDMEKVGEKNLVADRAVAQPMKDVSQNLDAIEPTAEPAQEAEEAAQAEPAENVEAAAEPATEAVMPAESVESEPAQEQSLTTDNALVNALRENNQAEVVESEEDEFF